MNPHCEKFHLTQIGREVSLGTPVGKLIPAKGTVEYIGATVHKTGNVSSELARRLDTAWNEFYIYAQAWKHSSSHANKHLK